MGEQKSLGCVRHFHDRTIKEWCGRQDGFSKSLGGGVDKTFIMMKRPSYLEANFGLVMECFKFWASGQTLPPFLKGVNFC